MDRYNEIMSDPARAEKMLKTVALLEDYTHKYGIVRGAEILSKEFGRPITPEDLKPFEK